MLQLPLFNFFSSLENKTKYFDRINFIDQTLKKVSVIFHIIKQHILLNVTSYLLFLTKSFSIQTKPAN